MGFTDYNTTDLKKWCGAGFQHYHNEYTDMIANDPTKPRHGDEFVRARNEYIFDRWLEDTGFSMENKKLASYIQATFSRDNRLCGALTTVFKRRRQQERENNQNK